MKNDIKHISIYYDYIKSRLPDYVPDEIVRKCLDNECILLSVLIGSDINVGWAFSPTTLNHGGWK